MKRFTELFFATVTLVVIVLFFTGRCRETKQDYKYIRKTDTIYDERIIRDTFRTFVYRTETVQIPVEVDTGKILQAYFEKRYYTDTLKNDTDAFIRVDELITQNRISERELTFINRRPTVINNTTVQVPIEKELREFSVGASLMFREREFEPGFKLGIRQKRVSYDFSYFPLSGAVVLGVDFNFKVKGKR
jgi:hypothetical protein